MNDNNDMHQENPYGPMDRLMELGMSAAVATQMINTMNQAMRQMNVPNTNMELEKTKTGYYIVTDGHQAGPFDEAEMEQLARNGSLTAEAMVWRPGMAAWQPITAVPAAYRFILLAK